MCTGWLWFPLIAVQTQGAPAAFTTLLIGCKEQTDAQIAPSFELWICLLNPISTRFQQPQGCLGMQTSAEP